MKLTKNVLAVLCFAFFSIVWLQQHATRPSSLSVVVVQDPSEKSNEITKNSSEKEPPQRRWIAPEHLYYEWSIGIAHGSDPFNIKVLEKPVLVAADVTDVKAAFVADPILYRHSDNRWYMFFELLNAETWNGDIAYAWSDDGLSWTYGSIVVDELYHLSYPMIVVWKDSIYMLPETHWAGVTTIYRATDFPTKWVVATTILPGLSLVDHTFWYDQSEKLWYLFNHDTTTKDMRIFYTAEQDFPLSNWTAHPYASSERPLGKVDGSRTCGSIFYFNETLWRVAQLSGQSVHVWKVLSLSRTSYEEEHAGPILEPLSQQIWRSKGMHTFDAHQTANNSWLVGVDGWKLRSVAGY